MRNVLITGGAGFIGSHLVDRLVEDGHKVTVVDNLSTSSLDHIKKHLEHNEIEFLEWDLKKEKDDLFKDSETVFHFAAYPDVKGGNENPRRIYGDNVLATFNVLETCRKNEVEELVFASSSTVYGVAREIPTPEDHPISPISLYGSTKAAGESLLESYAHLYDIKGIVVRYANIFGPRSDHGVMYDFYHKLRENSEKLEILGDGKQKKSYLYIDDCVDATLTAWENSKNNLDVFNIGSESQMTVNEIANGAVNAMGLNGFEYKYTGGERGWEGDVPVMMLDISKIRGEGWVQKISPKEGVRKYIRWLEERSQN